MTIRRERGLALMFGVHLTPWMYVGAIRARWIVVYVGPWRWEIEFIRHMEEHV